MNKKLRSGLTALALTMLGLSGARAQSPGGVSPAAWYRADAPNSLFSDAGNTAIQDGQPVQQWNESQGTSFNLLQATLASRPVYSQSTLANFHPTVTFDGSNDQMFYAAPTGVNVIDRASGSLYAAGKVQNVQNSGFLGFNASMDYPGLHMFNTAGTDRRLLFFTGGPGYQGLAGDPITANSPFTAGAGWQNGAGATAAYVGATASYNGERVSYSGTEMQNAVINNASRDLYIGRDNNYGQFSGQLNELMVFENRLSVDEMDRVETYLAIKYGSTFAKGTRDYKNSSSGTIWSASANNGFHHNIAGIGKDIQGALDQRQSWSTNPGQQLLIGSNAELQSTNAAHSSTISDGQFLIWGDNGLTRAPAVALSGPGINFRFAAIWKVQQTGSVGTVRIAWPAGLTNLKLIQSSDATIDSSDPSTDMTATQTVNGVSYNYADVSLSDGQFFTFAAFVQAPGGVVANLLMWHKANDGANPAGPKNVWKDLSVNGRDVSQNNNAAYQPSLITDATHDADSKTYSFNFNPFYYFDGSNDFFYRDNDAYFPSQTSPGSTYGVMYNSASGGFRTAYGWGDDDPNLVRGDNNYYVARDNGVTINENVGLNTTPAHIGGMAWKGSGAANNGMYLNLNGKIYGSTNTNVGNINDANNFAVGSEGIGLAGNGNEVYQGGISEVFAYSADHQNSAGDEKQRINSYLAIKYGITLSNDAGTGVPNYLSSKSAVIWDAATNTGYNNNIAGIARDENSALHQKQSFSGNAGQQVIIGTTGLGNTNEANATGLTEGQFLIWGDNGETKGPGAYNAGLGHGVNVLFKSVWKVQNTGGVGTVRIAWPSGLNNITLVQSGDATIDGSDTFTGMAANNQSINGVTYNYADVTLADGQYFTFATTVQNAPGGVFNGLSHWYRADIDAVNTGDGTDVTTWTDVASRVIASQIATQPMPKFKTGASDYFNFNPGLNFTSGTQGLGNLAVQTVTALNFDIYTLTKEGLSSGGANSRIFSTLVDNVTTTGGIRHWDGIGLNTAGSLERVSPARVQTYFANPGNVNYSPTSPSIMYNSFTDTSVLKGLNGASGPTVTHSANGQITGGFSIGTTQFSGNGSDNAGFVGNIGELIVYGAGNITSAERNKVESYLAIKYGVTLATTNNYVTSAAQTVWDAASNLAFYNNVAGLGRDDISALHQKQSRSQHTNTNNQVTIGLGQIAATNAANPGTIANGQFLIWGDNGQTQAMTNSSSSYSAFTYNGSTDNGRMTKRAWKVQNTAMGQEVLIRFPQASVGSTTFPSEGCSQFVLILADDAEFTTNQYVVALSQNGTDYEVRHTFPAGISYFTFGKVNGWAPGVVQLPAAVTVAPEFSTCASNSWYYAKQTAGTDKYLAIQGMTPAQLNNLDVLIDPAGAEFNGTIHTRLMPRVTTVVDAGAGTYTGVKVRVYYSQSELDATVVAGANKNGWFKFEGDANAARTDINADGLLNPANAIEVVPSRTGVEDGVKYVEFDNITSFSSFVYISTTNETALPVTLVRFDAVKKGNSTLLSWDTSEESSNKGFEIQRGGVNSGWQTVGFVGGQTEDGNSNALLQYRFSDETPLAGKNYYRLKQLDWNGSYQYSRIVVVDFPTAATGLMLYPNPVTDGNINLDLSENGMLEVKIFNLSGQQVKAFTQSGRVLNVKGLSSGKYILRTVSRNGQVYEKTFIIP